jgi:hypothetical protein
MKSDIQRPHISQKPHPRKGSGGGTCRRASSSMLHRSLEAKASSPIISDYISISTHSHIIYLHLVVIPIAIVHFHLYSYIYSYSFHMTMMMLLIASMSDYYLHIGGLGLHIYLGCQFYQYNTIIDGISSTNRRTDGKNQSNT